MQRLTSIARVSFDSRSGELSRCAWSGSGQGGVTVSRDPDGLRFHEQGRFRLDQGGAEVAFHNVYRWSLHNDHIGLYHERRGKEHAVWLFNLIAAPGGDALVAHQAHLCGDDQYTAKLTLRDAGIDLDWQISGPRKDERLYYRYRQA
ncbi:hypothetical protein SAMN05192555_102371 [Franzmannia pantelleriensis]|uniref:DUF6314 domain-containing protein n=1 Tax=Franzmannia pantelleriensis TaxID=48727 RepID=A0A1G9H7E9_9GAMM|nr:DUF6314 family protein [Halomonas pantelleriensis]SDL08724.1 hypothetical protein SAMN05192555_102371 [Halomonas pantelleriensis]